MKPFYLILIVLLTLGTSGGVGYYIATKEIPPSSSLASPQVNVSPVTVVTPIPDTVQPTRDSPELQLIVEDVLSDSTGTYSIIVKNLDTGETYIRNGNLQLKAASLYKLWIMAKIFDDINSKILTKDVVLSSSISVLNASFGIPESEAELTSGSISMSVNQALEKMITVSHNYAALLLAKKAGVSNINTFIKNTGFTQTTFGEGSKTTALDVTNFFEKIYYGQLINKEVSSQMLSLLKRQNLNTKIPKYLSPDTVIAHKTGELDDVTHDAGIIYSPKATYILVILTQSDSPPVSNEKISLISEAVYNYFNASSTVSQPPSE